MVLSDFDMELAFRRFGTEDAELPDNLERSELRISRQRSLAEQAADAIVEGIAANIFKPGERLVESDIAARLSVSRVPVREALKILEVQGIVVTSLHRSVCVADMDRERILQVREIRTAIEKIVVREVAARLAGDPRNARGIDTIVERMAERASLKDWASVSALDIAFHRQLCSISGNHIAITLWEALARHTRIIFGRETRPRSDYSFIVREHADLRQALLDGDLGALDAEIEHHINHSRLPDRVTG